MTIWNILLSFDIFYGRLVRFVLIWYIFPFLVCLDQEKSGKPAFKLSNHLCYRGMSEKVDPLEGYIHGLPNETL
jgi:hypothetical protein